MRSTERNNCFLRRLLRRLSVCLTGWLISAQPVSAVSEVNVRLANKAHANNEVSILPNLVGFGTKTVAGSGRHLEVPKTKVFKVSTLAPSGEGSFQECVYAAMPRVCVFEVSGTIDLTGDQSYDGSSVINLKHPYITIAGQTAPAPGITIKGKTLRIEAHDVLIQHLRFRVGDSPEIKVNPEVRDTLLIAGRRGDPRRTPHNIVIDHCSFSWGVDEVVSIRDSARDLTLSHNIISEGLHKSLHPKGAHSKGVMALGNGQTFYRNLIASVKDRAPLDISPSSMYINNLSFNSRYATFGRLARSPLYRDSKIERATTLIANVRKLPVNNSEYQTARVVHSSGDGLIFGRLKVSRGRSAALYSYDNACVDGFGQWHQCGMTDLENYRVESPLHDIADFEVWPARKLEAKLLPIVGARPADRDSVDARVIDEVTKQSAVVPNCVDVHKPVSSKGEKWSRAIDEKRARDCRLNAGGWPKLVKNYRKFNVPDEALSIDGTGYTKLERLLHRYSAEVESVSVRELAHQ